MGVNGFAELGGKNAVMGEVSSLSLFAIQKQPFDGGHMVNGVYCFYHNKMCISSPFRSLVTKPRHDESWITGNLNL